MVDGASPAEIPTQAGYNRWSQVYDGEDNPLVLLEQEHLQTALQNVAGLKIADIGCGTGRHALTMAHAGATVTAVDFSAGMLAKAKAKPGAEMITFVEHDLGQSLPLAEGEFDGVTCCLVLDHVGELDHLFSEMARICKPGGFLWTSVMHPAMNLKGVKARFIDPVSGERVVLASETHGITDYVMATVRTGWSLDVLSEHCVEESLATRSPRAVKYLGWPLLFLMMCKKMK